MTTVLATALAAVLAAQAPPVFRSGVEIVRVDVLVTRDGVPARGLQAADFELRDDGARQALDPVLEQQAPVDAVLVLDLSVSVRGAKLTALRSAARAFLDGLREGERAALLTFDDEVRLVAPPTGDLDAVRRPLETAVPRGSTALVDGVYAGLRLLDAGDRRTVVLAFSDGLENRSWLAAAEVVRAAARSNAVFYAVTVRAPGERPDSFLRDVAHATGGRVFEARSEQHLQDRFLEVLADIRARYVLSYAPTAGARPGWHALDVRVRRGKGSVLARPGYWLAPPAP